MAPPRSKPFARLDAAGLAPHFTWTERGGIVVLPVPGSRAGSPQELNFRSWDGQRLSEAMTLGPLEGELRLFDLGAAPGGALLSWVTQEGQNWTIAARLLPDGGEPSQPAAASVIDIEGSQVLWLETAQLPSHQEGMVGLVVFARRRGNAARIGYSWFGARASSSRTVTEDAVAWQLQSGPAGTWLATLEGRGPERTLMLRRLDDPVGGAVEDLLAVRVGSKLRGGGDLDLAIAGRQVTVALSASAGGTASEPAGPRLLSAVVDAAGAVVRPLGPITRERGTQRLVRVVADASSNETLAVWEESALDGPAWRRVLLGRLREGTVHAPDAWLDVGDSDPWLPLVGRAADGWLGVTRQLTCDADSCAAGTGPLLALRLPLGAAASSPEAPLGLSLGGLGDVAQVWDFSCRTGECAALVTPSSDPTAVHLVRVGTSAAPPAARTANPSAFPLELLAQKPRLVGREKVADLPELSDWAATPAGQGALLAWLTYFDPSMRPERLRTPAADGRLDPLQAEIRTALCPLAALDAAPAPPVARSHVISYRARSLGGVSLSLPRGQKRLLGWAALDQKEPQVFVTLLDEHGARQKQRMLTRGQGEISDVRALATEDGYVVLWVLEREGYAQIRAQRIDDELRSVGAEVALTAAAFQPTGLSTLLGDDGLFLAYADSSPTSELTAIQLLHVDPASLAVVKGPVSAVSGPEHLHSPELQRRGSARSGTMFLSFLEQTESDQGPFESELRVAKIGDALLPLGDLLSIELPAPVTSYALDCSSVECRGLAVLDRGRSELWAWAVPERGPVAPNFVVALGASLGAPAPILLGQDVFVLSGAGSGTWSAEHLWLTFD